MKENIDLLYTVPLYRFKTYLELENWTLVNENDRWIVFEDDGAMELAIPKNPKASDYRVYIDHVLKTLSFAQDKEPEAVADDILSYDLDVFGATLDNSEGATSISMRSADVYFAELKQLLIYSASSEEKKEPFFRVVPPKARKMLDHFQFGHTVRGSFGYRIESKIKAGNHVQYQMFADKPKPIVPSERRVLERIYKGLNATDKAVNKADVSFLTEGYATGLNANMCTAILNLAGDDKRSIKYSFKWSKKIPASGDLEAISRIEINKDHLEILTEASEYLYLQDPEYIDIVGIVTDLSHKNSSDRNELGFGAITIQRLMPQGRSQKIHVIVDQHAHLKAIEAYKNARTVGVRGYLEYKSSKWRLTDPVQFRIIT